MNEAMTSYNSPDEMRDDLITASLLSPTKINDFLDLIRQQNLIGDPGNVPTDPMTFSGQPFTYWMPDGRQMVLLADIRFCDSHGTLWRAPAGAIINGSNIPKVAWSFMTSPFVGKHRMASILHDWYCGTKERTADQTHDMFYDACIAAGVSKRRALKMWAALKLAGVNWEHPDDVEDEDDEEDEDW